MVKKTFTKAMKGKKKVDKQFRFSDESLEVIDQLSIKYFGTSDKKASSTIEQAIINTAYDMGIEQDELIIRCAYDLYIFYQQTATKEGKIMSVAKTAKEIGLGQHAIQRYRKELMEKKKLKAVTTSAVYIVNGGA